MADLPVSAIVRQSPVLGRDSTPSDETPGPAPLVILSYSLWERRYGKDPAILGQTVRLNRVATVIIGVMPRGSLFPRGRIYGYHRCSIG